MAGGGGAGRVYPVGREGGGGVCLCGDKVFMGFWRRCDGQGGGAREIFRGGRGGDSGNIAGAGTGILAMCGENFAIVAASSFFWWVALPVLPQRIDAAANASPSGSQCS
jgi:hypothetical protein